MMYKDKIKQLCQEQTNLDEADIEHLVQQADELLKNSAYANEDVFIDVKNIFSEHAIVIFHKKPESKLSLYENSVVGAMAYLVLSGPWRRALLRLGFQPDRRRA